MQCYLFFNPKLFLKMKINWTTVAEFVIAMAIVTLLNKLVVDKLASKMEEFVGEGN